MQKMTIVIYNPQTREVKTKCGGATEITDGQLSCFLIGFIAGQVDPSASLKELLAQFRQNRSSQVLVDWTRRVQGTFALILVDAEKGLFHCITDRVNSHKLFFKKSPKQIVIANTSLLGESDPDLSGLGSYLSNSGTFGGKTLFKDVQIIPRATVCTLDANSESSLRYWSMEFDASYANRKTSSLIEEFHSLVESACLSELPENMPLRILLSAGYDSSFLLGILAKTRREQLTAISYSLKENLKPGYDAYTAKLMSEQMDVKFHFVKSYNSNLMEMLPRAARFSECLTFIHEPDAYLNMQTDPGVRYITGDECLGWGNFPVRTREESACAVGFYNGAALRHYTSVFGDELTSTMTTGCAELLQKSLESAPNYKDLHDLKDWLYLEQRENLFVLGSRPYCLGQNWTAPLLNHKVLEFVAKLPSSHRVGKKLFKQMALKIFPGLYKLPRAHTGGVSADWKQELISNKAALLDWIKNTKCSLDNHLPANCWEQLFAMQDAPTAPLSMKLRIKQQLVRQVRGSKIGNALLSAIPGLASLGPRYLYSYASASQIAPTMMLMKLLIARHLYIEAAQSKIETR